MNQKETETKISELELRLETLKLETTFNQEILDSRIKSAEAHHESYQQFHAYGPADMLVKIIPLLLDDWVFDDFCEKFTQTNPVGGILFALKKPTHQIELELEVLRENVKAAYQADLEDRLEERLNKMADIQVDIDNLRDQLKSQRKNQSTRAKALESLKAEFGVHI